jgi:alginate O-acetyltransferase complex protein AlgI
VNFTTGAFFVFLPVVLVVYHLLGSRAHKYRFLLAASWLFYMSWNPWFIGVLVLATAVDYAAGRLIESAATPRRRRAWLTLSLVSNLGLLAVFKYTNFFVDSSLSLAHAVGWPVAEWPYRVLLPLGISFHTFQGISYTVDVYRGQIRAVRSFWDFALFVAFFPQLVAGPIVRAVEFLPQMEAPPRVSAQQVAEGLHWFLLGLFKKVFLADRLAHFVDPIFANPSAFDPATQRWAVLAYAAQIYCDFSGYSDIAIGCAKWFGFELPRNFNFPYLARSMADFWRRWHMSLSSWLRDYLYFPLGGSRRGEVRAHVNLMVTMALAGLWHGASWNWVLYGVYTGVVLCLHRLYDRALTGVAWADRIRQSAWFQPVAVAATLPQVLAGLVFARMESWAGWWQFQTSLVGLNPGGATAAHWLPGWAVVLIGLVAAGHLFSGLREKRCGLLEFVPAVRAVAYVAAIALMVTCGVRETRAFIYFQF